MFLAFVGRGQGCCSVSANVLDSPVPPQQRTIWLHISIVAKMENLALVPGTDLLGICFQQNLEMGKDVVGWRGVGWGHGIGMHFNKVVRVHISLRRFWKLKDN